MKDDRLDASTLVERAIEAEGHDDFGDDFGDPSFREGLDRLVEALNQEASLTDLGRMVADGQILGLLRTRLATAAWVASHPEADDEQIEQPIFLVGLSRSGTTALSHILSRDPTNRSLLGWEANTPVPPSSPAGRGSDARAIAARDAGPTLVEQINPGFTAIHHDPWDMPVECIVVLNQHFVSLGLSVQYAVPTYTRFVIDADHGGAYRWHQRVLRILQSGGVRGRWQLKSPQHALALDALANQYPDAKFVVTHRDPVECVASTASLAHSLSGTFCDAGPTDRVGALWADTLATMAERTMEARARLGEHRFIDVAYEQVKHDPVGAVRDVYAALDEVVSPEAEAAMRAHADVAVPNRHGKHAYSPEEFGLTRETIAERFVAYRERFAELL